MCAQVVPSDEYLRGHGRVAVDVTALRRLWQHSPVLGLVVLACMPVYAVLHGSLLCNSCGLSAVEINELLLLLLLLLLIYTMKSYSVRLSRHLIHVTWFDSRV